MNELLRFPVRLLLLLLLLYVAGIKMLKM